MLKNDRVAGWIGVGLLDVFCKVKTHLQLWDECVCALTVDIQAKSQHLQEAYFQNKIKYALFSDTRLSVSVFIRQSLPACTHHAYMVCCCIFSYFYLPCE